jgi:aspartate aminotransferase-like enzyme/GNAT superfamily N-acetyltransferase
MTAAFKPRLSYRLASAAWEFEAIHRLNYQTFVEEIPQHAANPERRLVDRFHAENTYAIGVDGDTVVAMVAGRCQRPCSLEQKLPDLNSHLPPHRKLVEVRLLAVAPAWRKQAVFVRLAGLLARHFRELGCDLAIISGTDRELKLYGQLGFRAFGPMVGTAGARYQPMYLTLTAFETHAATLRQQAGGVAVSYLPGPVELSAGVRQALSQAPLYHRSRAFMTVLDRVRQQLLALTGARDVVLMPGSGTLANDAVAGQIARSGGKGLVLVNGEFGSRLHDHALCWRLQHEVFSAPWGQGFDVAALEACLVTSAPRWLWAVAGETSSGVCNDVELLKDLCRRHGVELYLDIVSALGLQELGLDGVRMAAASSGKALAAAPGLALVFHNGQLAPAGDLPRYLDLAAYRAAAGVPYTQSSNLLAALDVALMERDWPRRWQELAVADHELRRQLNRLGFSILAPAHASMPGVITLALPSSCSVLAVAARMERQGYLLAAHSAYLTRRNWLQICLMGERHDDHLRRLPDLLKTAVDTCRVSATTGERS